jgi:hypothetical protein
MAAADKSHHATREGDDGCCGQEITAVGLEAAHTAMSKYWRWITGRCTKGNIGGLLQVVVGLQPWDPQRWSGKDMVPFTEYFLDFFFLLLGEGVDQAECMVKGALGALSVAGGGGGGWYLMASSAGPRQRDGMQRMRQIVPDSAALGEVKNAMVVMW